MAIDAKYIKNLGGRDYPVWAGVLSEGHERGLLSIEAQLVQIPSAENGNVAIAKASVTMKDGSRFEEYGDACPENVNQKAKIHLALIRMAMTRAKGRALRDAINCGDCLLEELPGPDEERQESRGDRYAREMPSEKWGPKPAPIAGAQAAEAAAKQGVPLVRNSPGTPEGDAAMAQARLVCSAEGCGTILRAAQVTLSEQRYGRRLCAAHQDEEAGK
jgi:hypothetical protein